MEKLWFYTQGASEEKQGPVSDVEMRRLLADGSLQPADLVWTEGMSNWVPVGTVPELQPSPGSATAMKQAPATGLPEGLSSWMTFTAVMTIIGGILQCLGCITALIGIPAIVGGVALLAAKDMLAKLPADHPALAPFLSKLKTFCLASGIVYIVTLVLGAIAILVVAFGAAGMLQMFLAH
jgi:hypothetical protein